MCVGLKAVLIFGLLLSLTQCQSQNNENRSDFAKRVRNFSFELLYHTSKAFDDHLVISPFQIWCLMTVLSQGAGGNSYQQLKTALNLPKNRNQIVNGYKNLTNRVTVSKSKGVTIRTANFIFFDDLLLVESDYQKLVHDEFNTLLIPMKFNEPLSAAQYANGLISRATNGVFPNALYATDFQGAQMIMTNVIDFKGLWTMPFNVSETGKEPFYNDKGVQIGEVNMMYQRAALPFANVKSLQGFALQLTYGLEQDYSLLIILPHPGVTLADMFKNFQNVDLGQIFKRIDEDSATYEGEEIDCWIPRFKITTDVILNKPLNDIGVYDIFDSEADLSGISKRPLAVSKVTQKAVLEVTEVGTTASAVASILIPDRIDPPKVKANRPFVYLVTEKSTTTVLFGGIYSKPSLF